MDQRVCEMFAKREQEAEKRGQLLTEKEVAIKRRCAEKRYDPWNKHHPSCDADDEVQDGCCIIEEGEIQCRDYRMPGRKN